MTSIKQLIDKDGNPIFPVTHTNAIFDSEGNRIEDRLSNIVNKTKNTKYSTVNGIKEFNCKDGYVDNIVIEGQTLVNLSDRYNVRTDDDDGISRLFFTQQKRCTNGTYTCFNFTDKPIAFNQRTLANETYVSQTLVNANSYEVIQVNADHVIYGIDFQPSFGWSNEDASIYTSSMFAVLEGDHSDKSISYFEGLKSVGQGDKIEVLSYSKYEGIDNFTFGAFVSDSATGKELPSTRYMSIIEYIPIDRNKSYCGYFHSNVAFYTSDKTPIIYPNQTLVRLGNLCYINNIPSNAKYFRVNVPVRHENKFFISSNYDYKQISTTLRSLPNGVRDTIEKRGNKYVKVQRCGEYTVVESDVLSIQNIRENCCAIITNRFPNQKKLKNADLKNTLLCNMFSQKPHIKYNEDTEGIHEQATQNQDIFFDILKSKLPSVDVNGAKTWLKSNPVTVVYELEAPIITELPNFNPQTYEGDTTLLLNTGVIQGECEFEVTNSMGSEIEVLKDKVSSLDTSVNKDILNVYSMDLFNGVETTGNKIYGVLQYNDCAILSAELNTTTELRYGQAIGKLHVTPKRASYPILILKINTGTCVQGWLYPDGTIKTLNSIPAGERICFTAPILL